jgi:hypothetical protein
LLARAPRLLLLVELLNDQLSHHIDSSLASLLNKVALFVRHRQNAYLDQLFQYIVS